MSTSNMNVKKEIKSKDVLKKIDKRVLELQKIPQPPQRTAEWYDFRNQRLTASDWGTIISGSKYASKRSIIKKKCNKEKHKMLSGKAIMWGVKYEEVAVKIYEKRNKTKVLEFGCLPHPRIPFLGASPDGITTEGIMLEIKCPYSRKITGIPSEQYWTQVQGQLEICELDYCDFFECKLLEYSTQDEYLESTEFEFKGCVIVFMDDNLKYKYCYSKLNIGEKKLKKWCDKKIKKYTKQRKLTYIEKTFWYLRNSSCVRINRDEKWFKETALPKLSNFWDKILECRKNPSKIKTSTSSSSSDDGVESKREYEPLQEGVCYFSDEPMKKVKREKKENECLFSISEKENKCKKSKRKKVKKKKLKSESVGDDECMFT
jgi:putative phage-type endonuclease